MSAARVSLKQDELRLLYHMVMDRALTLGDDIDEANDQCDWESRDQLETSRSTFARIAGKLNRACDPGPYAVALPSDDDRRFRK